MGKRKLGRASTAGPSRRISFGVFMLAAVAVTGALWAWRGFLGADATLPNPARFAGIPPLAVEDSPVEAAAGFAVRPVEAPANPRPSAEPETPHEAKRTTAPSPRPATSVRTRVGREGRFLVAPASGGASGSGAVQRVRIEVEEGLAVDVGAFAERVRAILSHPRGWARGGSAAFRHVDSGAADMVVVLASRRMTDRLCSPLQTVGRWSCYMRGRAVLNFWRWTKGAAAYGDDLDSYRTYMVNHEVGHALGHGHRYCGGAGRPAPVMMQQSMGVEPCTANPWPLRHER